MPSRRSFLLSTGSALMSVAMTRCSRSADQILSESSASEPIEFTVVDLAAAIREGRLSSKEVVLAYLERIEDVNSSLNAVVQLRGDAALDEANNADRELATGTVKGPLHGVPMTIKDSLDTAGVVTTGGTPGREKYIPTRDATVVARLREAGAILLGKTNTPELTMDGETDNAIYGRTNNPFDLGRTPGGSSGGAAAIIAASGSPFDIGSDTGGSIRWPAHCCGIAGFKPTSGRVSRSGHIVSFRGALQSLTQLGPLAKSVDDLVLVMKIIAGEDGVDPFVVNKPLGEIAEVAPGNLRIAFYTNNGIAPPTADVVDVVASCARQMEETGAHVEELLPPGVERSSELLGALLLGDPSWMKRALSRAGTTESPMLRWVESLSSQNLDDYSALLEDWDQYRSESLQFIEDFDVILSPAAPTPATVHGGWKPETESYLGPFNLLGWPAAVVRAGTSPEGLPLGIQIAARPWKSDVVLGVAKHLEGAMGPWPGPSI